MSHETLRKELARFGRTINPEGLQDVLDDKIMLTHTAHLEFTDFMEKARQLFAPKEDEDERV